MSNHTTYNWDTNGLLRTESLVRHCARYYEGQLDGAAYIDVRSLAAAAEITARGLHALAVGDATAARTLQAGAGCIPR